MDDLSDRDRDLLDALRGGESLAAYARRNHYTRSWAKWKSRSLRQRLGADSIEEVMLMADDDASGVSRADFDKLMGNVARLGDAVDELTRRPSPQAQEQVRERELDLKDHAKALGLSLEDVEKLKGEKEYARFKEMQERLEAERADEDATDEDANGAGGGSIVDQIRDGLGGIKHRTGA